MTRRRRSNRVRPFASKLPRAAAVVATGAIPIVRSVPTAVTAVMVR